eukprot:SAG31_NODE_263_length_18841_cov_17.270996_17_plen_164_part_01
MANRAEGAGAVGEERDELDRACISATGRDASVARVTGAADGVNRGGAVLQGRDVAGGGVIEEVAHAELQLPTVSTAMLWLDEGGASVVSLPLQRAAGLLQLVRLAEELHGCRLLRAHTWRQRAAEHGAEGRCRCGATDAGHGAWGAWDGGAAGGSGGDVGRFGG